MGRAIVREPQAFLFDEPLSNLDAKLRVQMRVEIRSLHNRLKATSIFVTHDQVEAMTLADMVVVMNAGRIEQIGAPTEVYRLPATRFVATFIGSPAMNLMPGKRRRRRAWSRPAAGASASRADAFDAADGQRGRGRHPPRGPALRRRGGEGELAFAKDFVEELGATRLIHGTVGDCADRGGGRRRGARRRRLQPRRRPRGRAPVRSARRATACAAKRPWSDRSSF